MSTVGESKLSDCSNGPFLQTSRFSVSFCFFFFSSRRRHTRSLCDWSSDVCSSDLSSSTSAARGLDAFTPPGARGPVEVEEESRAHPRLVLEQEVGVEHRGLRRGDRKSVV